MDDPKVIIIQTTPYNVNNSSRSLDTYFHYWDHDKVRQIFSRNWKPNKGHCGELFQIKDSDLLKKWLHKPVEVGTIFHYEDLEEQGGTQVIEDVGMSSKGYKLGRAHTPAIEIIRGVLWKKDYWCSDKLIKWLDDYKPEIIFYNFTYNLFLQKIVLFIADRYNIPIITAIGDDYYFNEKKSHSLTYHIFRRKYKKLTEMVFSKKGSAVYVCDKIKDKYNERFGLDGETIYFNSTIRRKPFEPINTESPKIAYFGNIRLGRNHALKRIADALATINPMYKLEVYSNEQDESFYNELKNHPNIFWAGSVPYSMVQEKISECDVYVIAEGFREEDLNFTRYSLSTKAADGLASGALVFAYGPAESGIIDYLSKTQAACVCSDENGLSDVIKNLLVDVTLQKRIYLKAIDVSNENHTLESNSRKFKALVKKVLNKN